MGLMFDVLDMTASDDIRTIFGPATYAFLYYRPTPASSDESPHAIAVARATT